MISMVVQKIRMIRKDLQGALVLEKEPLLEAVQCAGELAATLQGQ